MSNWDLSDRLKWSEIRAVIKVINTKYEAEHITGIPYWELVRMGIFQYKSRIYNRSYEELFEELGALMTDWHNTAFGGMSFGL